MENKRYVVVKLIDGVTSYYMRHPGTNNWKRGRLIGYWTKKKSKATVFYDQRPDGFDQHMFYETARDFILSVLRHTERVFTPTEWFQFAARETATHSQSLHYGRSWSRLKMHRWLYELPVSGGKMKASGVLFYMDLGTGEKHFYHKLESDLSKFERYVEHPAKKASRERRRTGMQMLADVISQARKDKLIP